MEELLKEILQGQKRMEKSLGNVENRFDNIDTRLENIENRVINVENRLENVENQQVENTQLLKALEHAA